MAIESSIVPLPVNSSFLPPRIWGGRPTGSASSAFRCTGWWAQGGLVVAGAVGSWVGATLMYWVSRWGGRPLVLRYGKYIFIPSDQSRGCRALGGTLRSHGNLRLASPSGGTAPDRHPRRDRSHGLSHLLDVHPAGFGGVVRGPMLGGITMGADLQQTTNLTHTLSKWLGLGALVVGGLYYFFVHRHMKGTAAEPRSNSKANSKSEWHRTLRSWRHGSPCGGAGRVLARSAWGSGFPVAVVSMGWPRRVSGRHAQPYPAPPHVRTLPPPVASALATSAARLAEGVRGAADEKSHEWGEARPVPLGKAEQISPPRRTRLVNAYRGSPRPLLCFGYVEKRHDENARQKPINRAKLTMRPYSTPVPSGPTRLLKKAHLPGTRPSGWVTPPCVWAFLSSLDYNESCSILLDGAIRPVKRITA